MVTAVRPVIRITAAEPWHPRLKKDRSALRQLNKVQDKIQSVVEQHLLGMVDAGVGALQQLDASAYDEAVRRALDDLTEPFVADLQTPLLQAMDLGAKAAQKDLPETLVPQKAQEIDSSWSVYDPLAVEYVQDRGMLLVNGVTDTTRQMLRDVMQSGIEAGLSRDEIASNMREELGTAISKWRARTIAQTEVIRAHTQGSLALYQKSGVVSSKRWLDGQPGACPFCSGLSGDVVPLDENFDSDLGSVDGPPLHPGCRCTVTAVLGQPAADLESRPKERTPPPISAPTTTVKVDEASLRRSVDKAIADVLSDYPKTKVSFVGTPDGIPRGYVTEPLVIKAKATIEATDCYAATATVNNGTDSLIILNPNWFRDAIVNVKVSMQRDIRVGWHPNVRVDPVTNLIAHELGHAVIRQLDVRRMRMLMDLEDAYSPALADETISQYAATSFVECCAEAFVLLLYGSTAQKRLPFVMDLAEILAGVL